MKSFPYINAFGVELEGGWDQPYPSSYLWDGGNGRGEEPPYPECATDENGEDQDRCEECEQCRRWERWDNYDSDDDNGRYRHSDGSVTVSAHWVGEIATPPYKSWTKFSTDFDTVYPTRVNKTCGMHMHVSVNDDLADEPALYGSMMTPRFERFILRGMRRWGKKAGVREGSQFWLRLEGKNDYCLPEFIPDRQWNRTQKDNVRYRRFNFCYSLNGNHTLEFRFLPMFEQKELGKSALKQLLRLTNRYLAEAAKKSLRFDHSTEEIELEEIKVEDIVMSMDVDIFNIEFAWEDKSTASLISAAPPEPLIPCHVIPVTPSQNATSAHSYHPDGYYYFSAGCECFECTEERARRRRYVPECQCEECSVDRQRMGVYSRERNRRDA